jgi:hypothetical protein
MEISMDQVRELADRYENCGLGGSSSGRFLRSVATEGRMPRGRGITWLEEIVSKGNPESVTPQVGEIEDLIKRSNRHDTIEALSEILRCLSAGWTLSDYKKTELERLRKQVNDSAGDLELGEKDRHLIAGLEARKRFSSYIYRSARPAIFRRLDAIFERWLKEGKISPDDWSYVRDNFKGPVAEYESGKHPVGALRWTRSGTPVTIMSEPRLNPRGDVYVEVLAAHGPLNINVHGLLVRAPK